MRNKKQPGLSKLQKNNPCSNAAVALHQIKFVNRNITNLNKTLLT